MECLGLLIAQPGCVLERLLEQVGGTPGMTVYHLVDVDGDAVEVFRRVGKELASAHIDISFLGIGENGHLAFNDPPADFEIEDPYLIVTLDEACRQQQVGEAWFADLSQVPTQAISMSVRQILKAREILAVVPDTRKEQAISLL